VFDLDGTIAETHPMAMVLIGGTIAAHGGPELTDEGVMELFGPTEKGIFRKVLGSGWEAAWETYLTDYPRLHSMCPEPFPGITGLLHRLHECGIRLGLVTGKSATTARISLETFGIADLFSSVEGGGLDGVVKARRLRSLSEAWDMQTDEMAYIGDTAQDVRESLAAGVTALSAAWSSFADHGVLAAEGPEVVFDTVADFSDWVLERACPGPRPDSPDPAG
jgi:phosphoglycolate phosphatase-like HAD superfamily hydrolase